jgi:hypothetical protein
VHISLKTSATKLRAATNLEFEPFGFQRIVLQTKKYGKTKEKEKEKKHQKGKKRKMRYFDAISISVSQRFIYMQKSLQENFLRHVHV